MTITFYIDYQVSGGQEICVSGSCDALGASVEANAIPMTYTEAGNWMLSIETDGVKDFTYQYLLKQDNITIRKESWKPRVFIPNSGHSIYKLYDTWQEIPSDAFFYTTPFTEVVYKRDNSDVNLTDYEKTIAIQVYAPSVLPSYRLGIIGKGLALGDWEIDKIVPMGCARFPMWEVNLDGSKAQLPLEYKFVVIDDQDNVVQWEEGESRMTFLYPLINQEKAIVSSGEFRSSASKWKGAGVAIPVFSLRSNDGLGIGEFLDLKKLVDWVTLTGQRIVQILPVNDTTITKTWVDSYPYKSISTNALHPIYLNLEAMGELHSLEDMKELAILKEKLNALPQVDYEEVFNAKWKYFRKVFAQDGRKTLSSQDFVNFYNENKSWLAPYAAFCFLRDKYQTPDFSKWQEYAVFSNQIIELFETETSEAYSDIMLTYFLQYHLDKQLKDAHQYAHAKGVAFKGDIPIGISRHSVEAWAEPKLFNMNGQAGAPPDDFSALGQNWGFPTYNWEEMEKDGYKWWKRRFQKMADYFDAYRIDHILGFFRIWQIPLDAVQGLLGTFNPSLPFTAEEIESYGLFFDSDRFLKPFIHSGFLHDVFGDNTNEVVDKFLNSLGNGMFELKDEFNTQRKIEAVFANKTDEKNSHLREGLYSLISEVLFIPDPLLESKYHPRIAAQQSYSYRHLNEQEQQCFDKLYNHFYYERHNEFWKQEALKKLPALVQSTDMLVCGEDLGMVPDSVPDVMNHIKILSLEIQRMPKNVDLLFGDPSQYPYLSVCTTSTHDMSTIRGWWNEDCIKTQQYYNQMLQESGDAPAFCEPWICDRILDMHLESPSMLCIIPLQDWLAGDGAIRQKNPNDERINIPSNPCHYWRYRMHLSLEEMLKLDDFNYKIRSKLDRYNRLC